ncbi:hypothetical protein GUI12_02415 [Anaplasmataceae bacterium AB001_6]|nr:hypothetical protein GUI12_02415 [Anaplasmataceae bacterium AB001_6]
MLKDIAHKDVESMFNTIDYPILIPQKIHCPYCKAYHFFKTVFYIIENIEKNLPTENISFNIDKLKSFETHSDNFLEFFTKISKNINTSIDSNKATFNIIKNTIHQAECTNCLKHIMIKIQQKDDCMMEIKFIIPQTKIEILKFSEPKNLLNKNFIYKYCSSKLISNLYQTEIKISDKQKEAINILYSYFDSQEIHKLCLSRYITEEITLKKITEFLIKNNLNLEIESIISFLKNRENLKIKYQNNELMRENSITMLKNVLFNTIDKSLWNRIHLSTLYERIKRIEKIIYSHNILDSTSSNKIQEIFSHVKNKYIEYYSKEKKLYDINNIKNKMEYKFRKKNRIDIIKQNSQSYNLEDDKMENYSDLWSNFIIKENCIKKAIESLDPRLLVF